jgi:hypothetical protein
MIRKVKEGKLIMLKVLEILVKVIVFVIYGSLMYENALSGLASIEKGKNLHVVIPVVGFWAVLYTCALMFILEI